MGDPLVTPAIVGGVVSILLTEVTNAAKMAYYCKDECSILEDRLKRLGPLVLQASQHSKNGNEICTAWLEDFEALLKEAKKVTKKCLQESGAAKWKRAAKFWRWKELPNSINDINRRIKEEIEHTNLVTLGVVLEDKNPPKMGKPADFKVQETPSLIVGVEEPFMQLKNSIIESHAKPQHSYLGLQGSGGAGKTLFAKRLHNDEDIRQKYGEDSILWITVGLDARICDLYKTLGNVLKDGEYERVYAHQDRKDQHTYFMNAFSKKKVLLILDDVWDKQRDSPDRVMDWLDIARAPGSATLITTRMTSVLVKVQAEKHVVLSLSDEDSWELFCSHAFLNGTRPSSISEAVARKVCEECKGLPLALKVIGSAMLDKPDKQEWSSALHDLEESKPILDSSMDDQLFGQLKWSYDELKDDIQKTCFLYFAAFPEDYKIPISTLCKIWIGEGLFCTTDGNDAEDKAMAHLEILLRRSLIDWDRDRNEVHVHDILRDLAVYIMDEAKPGECAHECFFQPGKVFKSFPSNKSVEEVKRMSFIQSKMFEWPKDIELPHLQVCLLSGISYADQDMEIPEHFFSSMRSLQYLGLSSISFNSKQKLPSFEGLMSLKSLDLSHCKLLKGLPESTCELKSLMELNLSGCGYLEELPESIGEFKCLMELNVSGCGSLKELPQSIGELKCLMELNVSGCGSLKELPETIGELKCLKELDLSFCESLRELPKSIRELKCLVELHLSWCRSLKELPKSIGELKCLTKLDLWGCGSLEKLPDSIGELKCLMELNVTGCGSLKELPKSIGELKCLTKLDLRGCVSLKELPESMGELKCLTELDLWGCGSLEKLPKSLGELKCLTVFK